MINKIITSEGNVQFIYGDSGKIINVHPFHVYSVFNVDTVSFLLIAMPKDSGLAIFTTKAENLEINGETYTFEELPNALSEAFAIAGAQARAEIVDELPETGMTNTIYLVPKEDGHGYDEYIYIKETGTWELIGDTDIELSRYVKKTDFNAYTAQTAAKIDYLSGATDAEVARATSAETALDEKIDGKVIELTQAEYDALAEVDPKVIYVITDAVPVNMADYVKKVDFNSYSAATKTAMDNETSARTNADTAEQTAREAADSFISGAVDTLSTALANEVQRAQNAESGLSEDIEDEMTRAMVIEDALQDAIDVVSGNVETETARAEAAESDLDDKIDAVSAATDDALALKLDATAYTPTVVDSALDSGSTNPVENQALFNELRIVESGNSEIVLFENGDKYIAINVPTNSHNLEFVCTSDTEVDITVNSYYRAAFSCSNGVVSMGYINQAFNVSVDGNTVHLNMSDSITGLTSVYDFYNVNAYWDDNVETSITPLIDQVMANTTLIKSKQDKLFPGRNITINGNVISADGGVAVDAALYSDSTNPVMNQALYNELRIVEENVTKTEIVMAEDNYGQCHNFSNIPSNSMEFEIDLPYDYLSLQFNNRYGLNAYWDRGVLLIDEGSTSSELTCRVDGDKIYVTTPIAIDSITGSISSFKIYTLVYEEPSITPLIDKVKENEEVTSAALNELNENKANASDLGGLKLVKITQSAYDALSTKDANTLYIIID